VAGLFLSGIGVLLSQVEHIQILTLCAALNFQRLFSHRYKKEYSGCETAGFQSMPRKWER